MMNKNNKFFHRAMALVLAMMILLSDASFAAATGSGAGQLICTQTDHVHTEACYVAAETQPAETTEATAEPTAEPSAEPTAEPTAETTAEPTAEPTEEPTEPATEPVVLSLYEQFLQAKTMKQLHDLMMGDVEGVFALTAEEIAAVRAYVEELFGAIETPTDDEAEYYDLIVGTLDYLLAGKTEQTPEILLEPVAPNAIYFDLSLGDVVIDASTYSGKVYVSDGTGYTVTDVTGAHNKNNTYYVFQSTSASTGYVTMTNGALDQVEYPNVPRITDWAQTIDNNKRVTEVVTAWQNAARAQGRTSTGYRVKVTGNSTFHVIIDDVWSTYVENSTGRTTAGVSFVPSGSGAMDLTYVGDNRLEALHYTSGGSNRLTLSGSTNNETLTVVSTNGTINKYNAAIGGSDSISDFSNLEITAGHLYAAGHESEYCTAIGGAGNGNVSIRISGGTVTAIGASNGAAIGGGFGGSGIGGVGNVTISGGTVYAYNLGSSHGDGVGVAIGGGSSRDAAGAEGIVTISGGTVYAEVENTGVAIGGGNSVKSTSSKGTVNILGGSVTAVSAGTYSIGGGTAKNSGVRAATQVKIQPAAAVSGSWENTYSVHYMDGDEELFTYYQTYDTVPYFEEHMKPHFYYIGWKNQTTGAYLTDSTVLTEAETTFALDWGVVPDTGNTVYFDLALGDVSINGTTYTGYIYDQARGIVACVKGECDGQSFYVYQSEVKEESGFTLEGTVLVPTAPALKDVSSWKQYITNNSDVTAVVNKWKSAAADRTSTTNRIHITGGAAINLTIDDIWSSFCEENTSRRSGGIGFVPSDGGKLTVNIVGDNRLENLHYNSVSGNNELTIQGESSATLTVASTTDGKNHWNSAIGASDSNQEAYNIKLQGGTIFAGSRILDNCTAIGAGGNGTSSIYINNATVTAVVSSSGTAIGGGIGYNQQGGDTTVTIAGGAVYAYNHGILLGSSNEIAGVGETSTVVPAVAIGGGSSIKSDGNNSTVVNISGGTVFARSVHGAAIGGGGSTTQNGGSATINISGGNVTAISAADTVYGYRRTSGDGMELFGEDYVAGVSIGGGTGSLSGGSAELNISGGTVKTGSIGGGNASGGSLGYAKVKIDGGNIQGQVIMQETGKEDEYCSFTMTGGTLDNSNHKNASTDTFTDGTYTYYFLEANGGAVCMKDTHGVTEITGGTIENCRGTNGGAIYMTGGAFIMTGGEIHNCSAAENGGAVYLGGGTFTMNNGLKSDDQVTNGTISNCSAAQNGGAVYLAGGHVEFAGGTIADNVAGVNGGGLAVNNGQIVMSGGTVSDNTATTGNGGGMYISATTSDAVSVVLYSGTVSGNSAAKSGGAVGVEGHDTSNITVQIGVNESHFLADGTPREKFSHEDGKYEHSDCPQISGNQSTESGGAFFISGGSTTNLNIYCLTESGNTAQDDHDVNNIRLSDFLMVEGGAVIISTANEDLSNSAAGYGKSNIAGSLHIVSGSLDLYGTMDNPRMESIRTIDLKSSNDHYGDHRTSNTMVKINYHENFYGPDGQVNSTYTSFDLECAVPGTNPESVPEAAKHTINRGLYAHEGYDLYSWNIDPNAIIDETETGWYWPQQKFTMYGLHDSGYDQPTTDHENMLHYGDLTVYAIWKVNGYFIAFDAGVPEGEKWSGSVDTMTCNYNKNYKLPENGFVWPGYVFAGWSWNGETYQPGDEVLNLTTENAATVTFTALWTPCTHADESKIAYTAVGNVMTKTCHVCGLSATATLTAQDVTYDGSRHPATLACSNESFWNPESDINYTGQTLRPQNAGADWTPVNIDKDKHCVNAGYYTATITRGGATVTAAYTISKAEQPAPASIPTYTPYAAQSKLTIHQLSETERVHTGYDNAPAEYIVRYYANNVLHEDIVVGVAGDTVDYPLTIGMTTYTVLVRYAETENYLPSNTKMANMTFYFDANISLTIESEEGIIYMTGLDNGQLYVDVELEDGYYLIGDDFTFTKTGTGAVYISIEGTIDKTTMKGQYLISCSTPEESKEARITIGTTKKIAEISGKIAEKQIFSDFKTDDTPVITRDSAYTVQYKVAGFDKDAYETPVLTFTQNESAFTLPYGTKIILRDLKDGSYWYYAVPEAGTSSVAVTGFRAMSGSGSYTVKNGDLQLQFVVDFSRTINTPTGDSLTTTLRVNQKNDAPEAEGTGNLTVGLAGISFSVEEQTDKSTNLKKMLRLRASVGGAASKYDHRDLALVLTPVEGTLPSDARIVVTIDGENETYRPIQSGVFIIALGNVRNMETDLQVQLVSDMFPVAAAYYTLQAKMYLSQSDAESAALNGTALPQTAALRFSNTRYNTGVTIREASDQRIFNVGQSISVSVTTKPETLPAGYNVEVQLHQQFPNGLYGNTAIRPTGEYTFSLADMVAGNYCIVATLSDSNGYVVNEARYYFILQEQE